MFIGGPWDMVEAVASGGALAARIVDVLRLVVRFCDGVPAPVLPSSSLVVASVSSSAQSAVRGREGKDGVGGVEGKARNSNGDGNGNGNGNGSGHDAVLVAAAAGEDPAGDLKGTCAKALRLSGLKVARYFAGLGLNNTLDGSSGSGSGGGVDSATVAAVVAVAEAVARRLDDSAREVRVLAARTVSYFLSVFHSASGAAGGGTTAATATATMATTTGGEKKNRLATLVDEILTRVHREAGDGGAGAATIWTGSKSC